MPNLFGPGLFGLMLLLPAASYAQAVKTGQYIGLQYGYDNIGGDFDDTGVLVGPSDVIDVPRVKGGGGAGLVWGIRSAGGGGLEVGWHRSSHRTTSVALGDSRASFAVLDLDGKYGLYNEGAVRGWVMFGLGFVRMTIDNSRVTAGGLADASYSGASLNLGLGGAYYPMPQLGLTLDLFWRQTRFSTVQGIDIDGGMKGPGTAWRLATTWAF